MACRRSAVRSRLAPPIPAFTTVTSSAPLSKRELVEPSAVSSPVKLAAQDMDGRDRYSLVSKDGRWRQSGPPAPHLPASSDSPAQAHSPPIAARYADPR